MIYEYKCPFCQTHTTSTHRGDRLHTACIVCQHHGPLHRVFAVSIHKPMMAHFNKSVGKEISSQRQFEQELRRQSDIATLNTGIEHRFEPIDLSDVKTLGVTEKGLDTTNEQRIKKGQKPIEL